MSKSIKQEVMSYIKSRKAKNPGLSVRDLSRIVKERFSENVSKSKIASFLNERSLSSPRGRRVSRIETARIQSELAGFGVFLAAEKITGVSEIIASALSALPSARVFQKETLEISTMSWLLSSMLYSTSFERAQEYEKNEIWGLLGRRASHPTLKRYIQVLNSIELVKNEIVMEIKSRLTWIDSIRIEMESGDGFMVDAQQRSLWSQRSNRNKYYLTSYFVSNYIMSCVREGDPVVILSGGPEAASHEPLRDLLLFDVRVRNEKLINIYLIDINGVRLSKMAVDPSRLSWIVGVWPWQIKSLFEISKPPTGTSISTDGSKKHPYRDTEVKIPQLIVGTDITIRMVLVYFEDGVSLRVALLTNVPPDRLSADEIVSKYFRRFNDPESLYGDLLETMKQPIYSDTLRDFESLRESIRSIEAAANPKEFFRSVGDMVCLFSLRSFFPSSAWGWTAMKVKECYLKSKGTIGWDNSDFVPYEISFLNELAVREIWDHVAREINSLPLSIGPLKKRLAIQINPS